MNKEQLQQINELRAKFQVDACMSIGAYPVLCCAIAPHPDGGRMVKLAVFPFSPEHDKAVVIEMLTDFLNDMKSDDADHLYMVSNKLI